jgi:hypothetical protein
MAVLRRPASEAASVGPCQEAESGEPLEVPDGDGAVEAEDVAR